MAQDTQGQREGVCNSDVGGGDPEAFLEEVETVAGSVELVGVKEETG